MSVKSTNVRLTPGFYLALKHMSETSNLSMGTIAGFFLTLSFNQYNVANTLPDDIQAAIVADSLSVIGDILKMIGIAGLHNTTIAELYQSLLKADQEE